MTNTPDTSFPAVAGGASAEERERLAQWCEEQIGFQRELMVNAYQIITVYGHGTIGPDRDEAAIRGDYANKFWRIAQLLRATPAAPVGAPSEAQIAQAWDSIAEREMDTWRWLSLEGRRYYARFAHAIAALSASLPPVEGAGDEIHKRVLADATRLLLEERRCYACGWPVKASIDEGCTPFNCSMRPDEHTDIYPDWHRRASQLHTALVWLRSYPVRAAASDRDAARWRELALTEDDWWHIDQSVEDAELVNRPESQKIARMNLEQRVRRVLNMKPNAFGGIPARGEGA